MKTLRIARDLLLVLVAIVSILGATFAVHNQTSFLTVTSRSMEPGIKAGDTLITKKIKNSEIEKGEVAVLPVPNAPTLLYAHRVVDIKKSANSVVVRTKGDANPIADAWSLEIVSPKVPVQIAVLPTSSIFSGPLSRSTILYLLLVSSLVLAFIGIFRLLKYRLQ